MLPMQLSFIDLLSLAVAEETQETDSDLREYGFRRLIGAVLIQAMAEAQAGDPDAAAWLVAEGESYLLALGIGGVDFPAFIRERKTDAGVDFGINGRGYVWEHIRK